MTPLISIESCQIALGAESYESMALCLGREATAWSQVMDGQFAELKRRDLYDRLAFEVVALPPLRARMDDVPALAVHFLNRFREEVAGITVQKITADAFDHLAAYDFPGNVRELKNVVERAVYSATSDALTGSDIEAALPPSRHVHSPAAGADTPFIDDPNLPLMARVEAFERALCKHALERTRYNQKEAAALLGITYDQFRQRYRKYRLRKD